MDRPVDDRADGASWLPAEAVASLRALIDRHLAGERGTTADIERVARSFAHAGRVERQPPEHLLIAMRSVWRDFGLAHGDRLQATALYDQLVRRTIEWYYAE